MNIKKIVYIIVVMLMAGWWSYYMGGFLKEFNPWFKSINIYIIYIMDFVVMMIIFYLIYKIYDKIKTKKEQDLEQWKKKQLKN